MSIFTRPRPPVKPTRKSHPTDRPFGEGIFPARPAPFIPSDADLAWAAYELNKHATDFDEVGPADLVLDAMGAESLAEDALERGLIPDDVATYIARTSLVGHTA